MTLTNIVNGDYGQVITLTVLDTDTDTAEDISGFTTLQMVFRDPSYNETTVTAAFDSDGTDGKIKYTIAESLIDEVGWWAVRARLTTATQELTSIWSRFEVQP